MNNIKNWYKFFASILLFLALANHSYGYYQFLRWFILIIGGHSAYYSYKENQIGWTWIFFIITILFNPIIPFYLSKSNWQSIDLIVGFIFLISALNKKNVETK